MIIRPLIKIIFCFVFAVSLLFTAGHVYALKTYTLQSKETTILYEESLGAAAKEVMDLYPLLKEELEKVIGWEINFKYKTMLIKDNAVFRQMAGNDLIVAFAVSDRNLIVIDYSKMKTDPFTLEATLQHELCHLLLHNYIKNNNLPRWLDEGVAQWISGGLADIIIQKKASNLERAVLSGRYLSFDVLEKGFPEEKRYMSLAYAESRSFVEYIIREYTVTGILTILQYLKEGYVIDDAIMKALYTSLNELEVMWLEDVRRRSTWLLFLTNNLYEILFVIGAFLLILAYIKGIMKKRKYDTDEDEDTL